MSRLRLPSGVDVGDIVAGVSVALVLIPQSLAFAEIVGVPNHVGLFAAALPPLLAAPFASSPYLQTGPVALTSILTFGALSGLATEGSPEYIEFAALLALIVGVIRLLLGLARLGVIAYLMSQPVLMGFTNAAAILIVSSQLPKMFGVEARAEAEADGVLERAWWTFSNPDEWERTALILSVVTIVVVLGTRRIHKLFPGVVLMVVGAVVWSAATGHGGPTVADLPGGFVSLSLDLPYGDLGSLLVPGVIIAVVGFAEPAAIARTFAAADRIPWSADRELVSQGVANLASGISGGFPVGGSFSRSSINRMAGASSRVSGAVTGAVVLLALPLSPVLEDLPLAVLGAIVVAGVYYLFQPLSILKLWNVSRVQAAVATGTFVATLVASPRVDRGILAGIGFAIIAHLYREMRVDHYHERRGDRLVLVPRGVVWFATAQKLESRFIGALAANPDVGELEIDLSETGRIDFSGAQVLAILVDDAAGAGIQITISNIPPHASRALAAHMGGRFGVPTLDEIPVTERHQWTHRRAD
jgi:SulP family sulfate permease